MDNDGRLDIVHTGTYPIQLNGGITADGRLSFSTSTAIYLGTSTAVRSIAVADYNGDGK